jgi:putative ABC transport system substrate-binding protein
MPLLDDPVADGFVSSLARPGGNLTGQSGTVPGLWAKRVELLKAAVPTLSRLVALWGDVSEFVDATASLGVALRGFDTGPKDRGPRLDAGEAKRRVEVAASWGAEGLLASSTAYLSFDTALIPRLALTYRLATISDQVSFTHAGGLMAYAADGVQLVRRAIIQVGKILQGADPAVLPMERPTQFVLSVNRATAQTLGITFSGVLSAQVTDWVS